MSAFIVNPDHINVIVSYFVSGIRDNCLYTKINGKYDYLTLDNAQHVAHILYMENWRSVNFRYNEETEPDYLFEWIAHSNQVYSIGEIASALDCLEYQSCETPDYHNSEAWEIVCTMRKQLLKQVQDLDPNAEGWEISTIKSKFHRLQEA